LVHISAMSDRFVSDPHQVVETGQLVKVSVLDVDIKRRRIALSMNLGKEALPPSAHLSGQRPGPRQSNKKKLGRIRPSNTAFAEAFARLNQGNRHR
ncbi:MAG: S1 RNA-binding domain-containing protein, partial [Oxalobacter sp.]|nr:S1 RNA-binding domain-containing protein [Oxalobacter sp.]